MKIRRILLINPSVNTSTKGDGRSRPESIPPLGLSSLDVFLRMHGYEVRILDLYPGGGHADEVVRFAAQFEPDVVGISAFTVCFDASLAICRRIKEVGPNIVTVLGGPHVTFLPEEPLKREPAVDYVIIGEGESSLLELLEALRCPGSISPAQIAGLAYREHGSGRNAIRVNPARGRLLGLDCLPFCDRDALSLDGYGIRYTLITSRGCPGKCIFCAAGALAGSRQRMRSVENFFSEVYFLCDRYQPRYLLIADDTFTASPERVKRFCNLMIRSGLNIRWGCESRVHGLTRRTLEKMAESGCHAIQFGVESGAPEVLRRIRKHLSLEKLHEVVRSTVEVGILPVCSLMLGHFCDTPEKMRRTIELARTLKEEYGAVVLIGINTVLPGTYQYIHRGRLGLDLYSEDWANFEANFINVRSPNFDREILAHFFREAQPLLTSAQDAEAVFQQRRYKPGRDAPAS
jgi:anaerobic magnesium-protoporphyrin IX monomethyl ester cyclase